MQTFTASKPGQIKQLRLTQQLKKVQPPGTGRRNPIQDTQQKGHYVRSMQTRITVEFVPSRPRIWLVFVAPGKVRITQVALVGLLAVEVGGKKVLLVRNGF